MTRSEISSSSQDPASLLEDPLSTSEEKSLGGITKDENPGDIILDVEEFVFNVEVEE